MDETDEIRRAAKAALYAASGYRMNATNLDWVHLSRDIRTLLDRIELLENRRGSVSNGPEVDYHQVRDHVAEDLDGNDHA